MFLLPKVSIWDFVLSKKLITLIVLGGHNVFPLNHFSHFTTKDKRVSLVVDTVSLKDKNIP